MSGVNIECFPCSGGMAEGFRRAGIRFDFAFDKDPDACDSYEENLGHRPIQMDVRDLLRMVRAGWTPGPVRLLVADPPCTPWSRAGKRLGVEDERDMLRATAELIGLLRPQAYLIGNVPGLDDSTQWHHIQDALAPLRKRGYCIADYTSLDAADFGVPQHRVRPFWFGHLSGPCVRWPLPTHGDASRPTLPGLELKPLVTCREALSHLPVEQLGRPVHLRGKWLRGGVFSGKTKRTRWSQIGQAMPPRCRVCGGLIRAHDDGNTPPIVCSGCGGRKRQRELEREDRRREVRAKRRAELLGVAAITTTKEDVMANAEKSRTCSTPGCGRKLRADNTRGICSRCGSGGKAHLGESSGAATGLRRGAHRDLRKKFRVVTEALGFDSDELLEEFMEGWLDRVRSSVRLPDEEMEAKP